MAKRARKARRQRKVTPLEHARAAQEKRVAGWRAVDKEYEAAAQRAFDQTDADIETLLKVFEPSELALEQRIKLLAHEAPLSFPRVVLGLYEAELEAAQEARQQNGLPEYGGEEPSDTAYNIVGELFGLGADRIKQLCADGRVQLRQGMSASLAQKIRASELRAELERKCTNRAKSAKRRA